MENNNKTNKDNLDYLDKLFNYLDENRGIDGITDFIHEMCKEIKNETDNYNEDKEEALVFLGNLESLIDEIKENIKMSQLAHSIKKSKDIEKTLEDNEVKEEIESLDRNKLMLNNETRKRLTLFGDFINPLKDDKLIDLNQIKTEDMIEMFNNWSDKEEESIKQGKEAFNPMKMHEKLLKNIEESKKISDRMEKLSEQITRDCTSERIEKLIKLKENEIEMINKTLDETERRGNKTTAELLKQELEEHNKELNDLKTSLKKQSINKDGFPLIEYNDSCECKKKNEINQDVNAPKSKTDYSYNSTFNEISNYNYLRCNNFKVNFFGIPSCLVESFESGNTIKIVFKETKEFSVEKYLRENQFFKRYDGSFTVEYLDSALQKVRVDTYNMRDVSNVIFECKGKNYADDSILTISITFYISDPRDHTITLLDQDRKE